MELNNAKEYLPVILALAQGIQCQYKKTLDGEWFDFTEGPIGWKNPPDWYRVKPGEMPLRQQPPPSYTYKVLYHTRELLRAGFPVQSTTFSVYTTEHDAITAYRRLFVENRNNCKEYFAFVTRAEVSPSVIIADNNADNLALQVDEE